MSGPLSPAVLQILLQIVGSFLGTWNDAGFLPLVGDGSDVQEALDQPSSHSIQAHTEHSLSTLNRSLSGSETEFGDTLSPGSPAGAKILLGW